MKSRKNIPGVASSRLCFCGGARRQTTVAAREKTVLAGRDRQNKSIVAALLRRAG